MSVDNNNNQQEHLTNMYTNEYVYSPNKAETQAHTHTHTNTQYKNNKMH